MKHLKQMIENPNINEFFPQNKEDMSDEEEKKS